MTVPARRPWWRKKRWAAALAVWLVVMYPLSAGPAQYAMTRGWVSPRTVITAYLPVIRLTERSPAAYRVFGHYTNWWHRRTPEGAIQTDDLPKP